MFRGAGGWQLSFFGSFGISEVWSIQSFSFPANIWMSVHGVLGNRLDGIFLAQVHVFGLVHHVSFVNEMTSFESHSQSQSLSYDLKS